MSARTSSALQSERLKRKRSFATWLVVAGAFFTPAIVVVIRSPGEPEWEWLVRHRGAASVRRNLPARAVPPRD